jgi:hypothetical protein
MELTPSFCCCAASGACARYPCKKGKGVVTCRAKAGAPKGRTCTCNVGFEYKNDASGCLSKHRRTPLHMHASRCLPGLLILQSCQQAHAQLIA